MLCAASFLLMVFAYNTAFMFHKPCISFAWKSCMPSEALQHYDLQNDSLKRCGVVISESGVDGLLTFWMRLKRNKKEKRNKQIGAIVCRWCVQADSTISGMTELLTHNQPSGYFWYLLALYAVINFMGCTSASSFCELRRKFCHPTMLLNVSFLGVACLLLL